MELTERVLTSGPDRPDDQGMTSRSYFASYADARKAMAAATDAAYADYYAERIDEDELFDRLADAENLLDQVGA